MDDDKDIRRYMEYLEGLSTANIDVVCLSYKEALERSGDKRIADVPEEDRVEWTRNLLRDIVGLNKPYSERLQSARKSLKEIKENFINTFYRSYKEGLERAEDKRIMKIPAEKRYEWAKDLLYEMLPAEKMHEWADLLMPSLEKAENQRVYISKVAIERSKKDRTVNSNLRRYMSTIGQLEKTLASGQNYQAETIGDFRISPRGGIEHRIAWHTENNADGTYNLFIDDLLYHTSDSGYVDDWATKARQGDVTINDYRNRGYLSMKELENAA